MHDFTKPYNLLTVLVPVLLAAIFFSTVYFKADYESAAIWTGSIFMLFAMFRTYKVYLKK